VRTLLNPSGVPGQWRSMAGMTDGEAQRDRDHDRVVGVTDHRQEVGHEVDRREQVGE